MKQHFSTICGCFSPDRLIVLLLFFVLTTAVDGKTPAQYHLSGTLAAGEGQFAPFWLHQGVSGTRMFRPNAMHFDAGVVSEYTNSRKAWEMGYGVNTVFRVAPDTADMLIDELYMKLRFHFLEVSLGNRRYSNEIEYESLSSGGMLFSGNALPLPGIRAGFNRFVSVPFIYDMFQLNGAISHAWFTDKLGFRNVMLHHKYVHFQLGKPLPVRLQYRFDHVVQWGGKSLIPGVNDQPSGFQDFIAILLVKSGREDATHSDQINLLGNHIISQSLKLEVETTNWLMTTYWQGILEDKPFRFLGYTMNSADGLWGITLQNKYPGVFRAFLYEFLNTTDQSGPYHDRDGIIYGGGDNYFTGFYPSGWSHRGNMVGTPFVPARVYTPGMSIDSLANRVRAHHFGVEGSYQQFSYRIKASFVKGYGGNSNGGVPLTLAPLNRQRYYLFDVHYVPPRWKDYTLGVALGIDRGRHTGNATGVQVSLRRVGLFH